ncbi:MAG: hypothetical protein KDE00_01360 [Rhodobacteraceae bacterium]|nr:hypothetical protein [Paracoccaceae bacterium]
MLSLSAITLQTRRPGPSGPVIPPGAVTVTAFSRDRTVFDSGAGVGLSSAIVPLSGTGTAGEIVEARAVSLDDGGATTTAWADIGTISAGGTWSGTIAVPRSTSWLRPEVRLKAQPGVAAQGANRFGVGHVIAIWGQSEPDRILSAFYDNTTPPPVSDPEAVQFLHGAGTTPTRSFITNAAPLTAAAAAMAATLIAVRPGEKFAVVFQTVSGTDPRALVNDADTTRNWAADKALHDFATADGQHVGIAAMSWFAAPSNLGASYGEALFPLFSGKTTAGATVTFPATISYGSGQSYHADHWFGELYDYSRTRWVPYGPHKFDIDADMQDAKHYLGGAVQANLNNKELCRLSWRAMLALPAATMFRPLGIEPVTYVNGFDDGAGGWTDIPHPAGNTPDGTQAFARLTAHAILQSAGLATWTPPVFDNCLWEATGAWVEVWSSAGPVTTTRLARGEPALGSGQTHWTEVMGFQINGLPARNTQIVAGRVRIFPNTGVFTNADAIQYGEGGASGMIAYPEDFQNATWKNLPIVDLGLAGLTGVPVRPMAEQTVLANTLPAAAPQFTTAVAGPYFTDSLNVPAGTTAITYAGRFKFASYPASTFALFAQANIGFDVELMNNGNLRINIKDSAGTVLLSNRILATALATGVWYDVVVSASHVTRQLWVEVNGTLAFTVAFTTAGSGSFQSNRVLNFLSRCSGSLQYVGQVEYLRAWFSATGTGAAPAGTPYKQVTGPAAVANADAWKRGANAT